MTVSNFCRGVDLHHEPPFAAVDEDALQVEDGGLGVHRKPRACPEGADAAHQVAGVALGILHVARLHPLHAQLPGELLGGHLPVAVHEDDEGLMVLLLHDERLDHAVFGYVKALRHMMRPPVIRKGIQVSREIDLLLAEEANGLGDGVLFLCHGL